MSLLETPLNPVRLSHQLGGRRGVLGGQFVWGPEDAERNRNQQRIIMFIGGVVMLRGELIYRGSDVSLTITWRNTG